MNTSQIIWKPTRAYIEGSRVKGFMDQWGIRTYKDLYQKSINDIAWFWPAAMDYLGVHWHRRYDTVLDLDGSKSFERARWFINGKLSIAYNCLDRHAADPQAKNRVAFIWETEDGTIEKWTYLQLHEAANQCANALKSLGVRKGVTVGLYMPMIPELIVAFWACMKLGAPLIPVFSGFGAKPLAVRLADAKARVLVSADTGYYKTRPIPLKQTCDEAAGAVPSLRHIIVVKRQPDVQIPWESGRDVWWHEIVPQQPVQCKTAVLDAEDLAMILYSSGTTGKPKGTLHRVAGVFAQVVKELGFHFDVKPDSRFYWITNIGWMMGPWLIYATLINGACMALFEGLPSGRGFAEFVARTGVSVLGVVPSLVRAWKESGACDGIDWSKVRLFSSTGEPSNRRDYLWLMSRAGYRAPVVEYCGGTEIGGGHLTGTVVQTASPATFSTPALGLDLLVLDEEGREVLEGAEGEVFLVPPSIGLSQKLLNRDHDDIYYARCPRGPAGEVLRRHGDQVARLPGGYFRAQGRADDTMNLGGIKVSSLELERVLESHPAVYEAAAVAVQPENEGAERLVVFAVLADDGRRPDLKKELATAIASELNPLFKIHDLVIVDSLPRTASNKLMRRQLRRQYAG